MKNLLLLSLIALLFSACNATKAIVVRTPDSLQQFISQAKAGDVIQLERKTYELNEALLIEGKEKLTIDGNGATLLMRNLDDDVVKIIRSKQIVLINVVAKHIDPQGPIGCTGNVVQVDDCTDITIRDSELNGSGIVGVAAYNSDQLKIIANHIHRNSEYGIIYQGPSVHIEGNTFENNGDTFYYSFVPRGEYGGWPPKELIRKDVNKEGLMMKGNTYK